MNFHGNFFLKKIFVVKMSSKITFFNLKTTFPTSTARFDVILNSHDANKSLLEMTRICAINHICCVSTNRLFQVDSY